MIFGLHTYNDLVKKSKLKVVQKDKICRFKNHYCALRAWYNIEKFCYQKNMDNTSGYKKVDSNT